MAGLDTEGTLRRLDWRPFAGQHGEEPGRCFAVIDDGNLTSIVSYSKVGRHLLDRALASANTRATVAERDFGYARAVRLWQSMTKLPLAPGTNPVGAWRVDTSKAGGADAAMT